MFFLKPSDIYGDITIRNAVSKAKAFYTPVQKVSAYEDFDDKKNKLRELNPADTSKYPWTDMWERLESRQGILCMCKL